MSLDEPPDGRSTPLKHPPLVHFLFQEMELIGTDVLGSELIRGGLKMLGELGYIAQIAIDGVGREVADLHVFEHASA
jgi:hypothetical protein